MSSADAVMDVIAPPARTAPARAPVVANADEPTFEDHLEAAAAEEAPAESASAPTSDQTRSSETHSDALLGGPESAPAPTPSAAPDQTASPVIVQLIAAAPQTSPTQMQAAPAPATEAAPTTTPSPTAGEAAQPVQPPPSPAASPAPPATDAAPEQSAAPSPQISAPQGESAAQHQAAQTAPAATQQTAPAPTAAAPAAPPTTAAAAVEVVAAAPSLTIPVQSQPAPDAKAHAKSARGEMKTEAPAAPDQGQFVPGPAPVQRVNAKPTAPQTVAREVSVVPLDAPETTPAQTQSAPAASAAQTTHAQQTDTGQAAARALPAAHQVAREIVRRFEGGNTRFELRLDPPELGRVEVRLDVSRDHRVTAVIAADSPQALTELARHARELEQMLQGAGLELGDKGLSFDLRQHAASDAPEFGEAGFSDAAPSEETAPVAARPLGYERWRGVRVDMMV